MSVLYKDQNVKLEMHNLKTIDRNKIQVIIIFVSIIQNIYRKYIQYKCRLYLDISSVYNVIV